uniref:Uncharacterized protein n=1 Tax=Trichuris muris TaxID=70415 RepID=A0A5S6Q6V7_TRIMR
MRNKVAGVLRDARAARDSSLCTKNKGKGAQDERAERPRIGAPARAPVRRLLEGGAKVPDNAAAARARRKTTKPVKPVLGGEQKETVGENRPNNATETDRRRGENRLATRVDHRSATVHFGAKFA